VLALIVRRLGLLAVVLVGLSVLLFAWVRALPGDPARALLGEKATPEGIATITARYGFDQPVWQQYLTYVGNIVRGDFGASIQTGEPVVTTFLQRFPATIELSVAALVLAVLVGIPLGYLAAVRRGGWLDNLAVGGSLLGVVVPVFFLAVLLKYLLAIELGWFPTSGRQDARIDATHVTNFYVLDGLLTREWDASWDAVLHLVLPALALGSIPLAIIVRITRASVLEVLSDDHVRTAQAKGLARGVISRRHVLRNALLPVSTTLGLQVGALLSGAVLTETVFSINGIGSYLFAAVSTLDYPVLQGFILFIAVVFALVNLLVDISYGFIDPRVRVS